MKKRFYLYLILLLVAVIIFLFYISPTISPFYCSKYSGYDFNGGTFPNNTKCLTHGCKIKEFKIAEPQINIKDMGSESIIYSQKSGRDRIDFTCTK